jgi:hypothetical protein
MPSAGARGRAALGFRVHSGWAAAVAVAGTPARPEILERRRIDIADPAIRGSAQPYHAAEGMPVAEAKSYLDRCASASAERAGKAVADLAAAVRGRGRELAGGALLLASGRPLPALESVLASHALIHTADGEHFREAIQRGCEQEGVELLRFREREVPAAAAARFRTAEAELMRQVAAAGKALGAPWRADEKLAALVAWLTLSRGPGPERG